jgi:hypothetical protein
MPKISMFFGIAVYMYFDDHNPAHFHVRYNEFKASININTLAIMEGALPNRALKMVMEWAEVHQSELLANWQLCATMQQPKSIEPLQ